MMQILKSLIDPRRAQLVSFDTLLKGHRVVLRMPCPDDWKSWLHLRETGRQYLEQWEPKWPDNALSYSFFCSLQQRQWRDWRDGKAYAFSILLQEDPSPKLIGGITLSDIRMLPTKKGTVGYWMGQPHSGKGYMSEALGLVCEFAHKELGLQKIEASCLPGNEPSKAVLKRAGFEHKDFARSYLQINGRDEDHLLWSKDYTKQTSPTD